MILSLVTPAVTGPVTVQEVKEDIRGIRSDTEDLLIATLIESATLQAETFTRRNFVSRTWDLYSDTIPQTPVIDLPCAPLVSVTSITTIDADEASTVYAASNYILDTVSSPGRIALKDGSTWPSTTLKVVNGFVIRFVSGYGTRHEVPAQIRHAIMRAVNFYYSERTSKTTKKADFVLPQEVKTLLLPYKVWLT